MLDHIGIRVKDFEKSRAFYVSALKPLGYGVVIEFGGDAVGLGKKDKPQFWIGAAEDAAAGGVHIAFVAKDRAAVNAFYEAAISAGATDNGPPGLRPHYHPDYYAAFVLDPDGVNIEAVCHMPE